LSDLSPNAIKLFRTEPQFMLSVAGIEQLPPMGPAEIAFWGRSNVGKSSLINALVGRGNVARTSNTPGRTQELNFFAIGEYLRFVDMPGYGYAEAPPAVVKKWADLSRAYLRGRSTLKRVMLLIDGRHGIKSVDETMMKLLDEHAVSYVLLMTKVDAVKPAALETLIERTLEQSKKHGAAYPEIFTTSSRDQLGLDAVRQFIYTDVLQHIGG
jgi:GTP-binding protein